MSVFRPSYRELSAAEQQRVADIKERAQMLYVLFEGESREFALARTKLEEAVMWAVKAIT